MLPQARVAKGQRSRLELTKIAIDCFSRFGYRGTSIERIARAAGVTKGAIYYHFRDKEDLLLAAVSDRVKAFENRVQAACEDIDPSRALRSVAEVCVKNACWGDHPRFTIRLMVEAIDTNDRVSEQLRGMMRRFRAFMRNLIRSGQRQGLFRHDIDAETAAASFTSSVLGAEIQFYQDPERLRLEETIGLYVDQLMNYLAPPARAEEENPSQDSKGAVIDD